MNGVRKARWRGPPLALQIMALLVGGLIVAQLVTLLLTLLLPPAPAAQYGLDDIAAALLDQPGADIAGNGLQRIVQPGPPDLNGSGWLVSERSQTELAGLIGVEPRRVSLAFYTPLPFAGTTAARSLAMADDGFLPPFKADAVRARGAAFSPADGGGGLLLVQYAANHAADMSALLPRGNRLDGAAPGRDGLPPGLVGRGGPAAGMGVGPGGAGAIRGGLLPRQDRVRPLISVDPRYAGDGLSIPGDGGAAIPALLRGGADARSAPIPAAAAGAATPVATANKAASAPQVSGSALAAAQSVVTNPALLAAAGYPRSGGPLGPIAMGIARAFPDRALITAQTQPPSPIGRIAPPLIAQPPPPPPPPNVAPAPAPQPGRTEPAIASAPPPTIAPGFARAPMMPVPAAPRFAPTPEAAPYERPAGPPITVTSTRRSLFGLAAAPFVEGDFVASLKLADGKWAVVQPALEPFPNSWQRRVLLWFAIALCVVVPLGWLFARRLVTPLHRFASAAEQLGREPSAAIVPLDGPAEIGRAAHAFNLMQGRMRAFVDDRTAMVGAISHDLRTPLTRMRFRIEDVDDGDVRDGLLEEVDEMEAMIAQVIEFIRDASTPGARERLDLRTLVDDVVEDARLVGGDVVVERAELTPVEVDVLGMRRLLDNLLENAVKYGVRARIRLRADGEDAIAEIIDDGPGLPEDEIERVFEPFYRSEAAIASDKKGTGLGLAVCRSIARAHGGDVRLIRRADGFRAEVRLPLAFGDTPPLAV